MMPCSKEAVPSFVISDCYLVIDITYLYDSDFINNKHNKY